MSVYTEFFIGGGGAGGERGYHAIMLSYYHIIMDGIDINTRETLERVSTAKEMNRYLTISAGCKVCIFFLSFFLDYKAGFVHIIYV